MKRIFTFIELLIVVAVISILLSLLLPSLSNAREKAKRAVCASNQKQTLTGSSLFANNNNGRIQPGGSWIDWRPSMLYIMYQDDHRHFGNHKNKAANFGLLIEGEYMGSWDDDKIFRCPSNSRDFDSKGLPSHFNFYKPPGLDWVNKRADYMRKEFLPLESDWSGVHLSKIEPGDPLYADTFSWSGAVTSRHSEGVNATYIDGNVKFIYSNDQNKLSAPGRNDFVNNSGIESIWTDIQKKY